MISIEDRAVLIRGSEATEWSTARVCGVLGSRGSDATPERAVLCRVDLSTAEGRSDSELVEKLSTGIPLLRDLDRVARPSPAST